MSDERAQVTIMLASALAAWARDDRATFATIVGTLHANYVVSPALPGVDGPMPELAAKTARADEHRAAALRLFAFWADRCQRSRAKPVGVRIDRVVARLRDGYSEAEIRRAIEGAAIDPFIKDGTRFDDLELICRDGTKLEAFLARAEKTLGAIPVDRSDGGSVEEMLMATRREMASLKRAGRNTEYEIKAKELAELLQKRKDER